MYSISSLMQPIKVESLPISTPTPPSSDSIPTKQEQLDQTSTHTVDIPPTPFINSIDDLRRLSTTLSTFLCRYDELNNHMNSIKASIDSKLSNQIVYTANPNQSTLTSVRETSCAHTITVTPEATVSKQNPNGSASNCGQNNDKVRKPKKRKSAKKPEKTDSSKKHEEIATSNNEIVTIDTSMKLGEIDSSKNPEEIDSSKKHAVSELESICERMSVRGIKKYVSTHISDTNKLREELPKALKFARDPAKLVLDSIGRFFLQGSKAFANGSKSFVGRLVSNMILECFVMISSDGIEIREEHKKHAAEAADDWKKRMKSEGGLITANEDDARGLLLLISGFGIPNHVFGNMDIRDLIQASNVKEISTALRRSIFFIPKVPELIDWMAKSNMEIEAADLAYTLGLVDKPRTILTTFFQHKIKDRKHNSVGQIKDQLSDLKSLQKCLEAHNIAPSNLFPGFEINKKIQQLEKEIDTFDLKATQKRKAEPKPQEAKRGRVQILHQQIPYFDPTIINEGTPTVRVSVGPIVDHLVNGGPYFRPGQPYFPQPSLGQPYSSQPSSSGSIGLYGRSSGLALMEPGPGFLDSGRRGPDLDLYGFADKVLRAPYGGSHY